MNTKTHGNVTVFLLTVFFFAGRCLPRSNSVLLSVISMLSVWLAARLIIRKPSENTPPKPTNRMHDTIIVKREETKDLLKYTYHASCYCGWRGPERRLFVKAQYDGADHEGENN